MVSPRIDKTNDSCFIVSGGYPRLPIYVSPTAWGDDPTSTNAIVEIAYVGSEETSDLPDESCVWHAMTNITAETTIESAILRGSSKVGVTEPGFSFVDGANQPQYKGRYRLKMTTTGDNPVTKTTDFYFADLPDRPTHAPLELAANARVENHYPWEHSIDYIVSFTEPINTNAFTDTKYMWVGLTASTNGNVQRLAEYQCVTQKLNEVRSLTCEEVEDENGKTNYTYHILINLDDYPVLEDFGKLVGQGAGLVVGMFLRDDDRDSNYYRWRGYDSKHHLIALNTDSPRIIGQGTKTFSPYWGGNDSDYDRTISPRLPIYVSPTAWGADTASTQATVEIAYIGPDCDTNAAPDDDGLTYSFLTNVTAETWIKSSAPYCGDEQNGFGFHQATNVAALSGLYRLKMTTQNGSVKRTDFYFSNTIVEKEPSITALSGSSNFPETKTVDFAAEIDCFDQGVALAGGYAVDIYAYSSSDMTGPGTRVVSNAVINTATPTLKGTLNEATGGSTWYFKMVLTTTLDTGDTLTADKTCSVSFNAFHADVRDIAKMLILSMDDADPSTYDTAHPQNEYVGWDLRFRVTLKPELVEAGVDFRKWAAAALARTKKISNDDSKPGIFVPYEKSDIPCGYGESVLANPCWEEFPNQDVQGSVMAKDYEFRAGCVDAANQVITCRIYREEKGFSKIMYRMYATEGKEE